MRANELYDEAAMTYDELVDYLKKKYGAAQYDYFCNATLISPIINESTLTFLLISAGSTSI